MRRSPEARLTRAHVVGWIVMMVMAMALQPVASSKGLRAQDEERPEVMRALELENNGKYRDAAVLFRSSLRTSPTSSALLGLERVYAELGMSDSLLAPLDTLIAAHPREALYRSVQLRTLQILRRDDRLRAAFESWVRATPRDPAPYREYARVLIQLGKPSSADSIVARGRVALGGLRDLEYENAQLRAAMGQWVLSAQAWRRALTDAPHLASAASYALAPAPIALRDSICAALILSPPDPGPRSALSSLELAWGRPQEAWETLRGLRADTTSGSLWEDFGDRAYSEERWSIAREAYMSALKVRRNGSLAMRAAAASLRAGAPRDVFTILPLAEVENDPPRAAREYLPLHVAALVALGRAADADTLIARYDRWLAPGQRMRLAQTVATAWVRAGDLPKARAALSAAGPEADSSEAAGLLALYDGRVAAARALLHTSYTPNADLALAMGLVARVKGDNAPDIGAAFLSMARGDSAGAAAKFVAAAPSHQEVAPALLLIAARLNASHVEAAIPIWQQIVTDYAPSPEAFESELEWARALRRRGDMAGATAHLEHLILSAPQSALLPQARRELELTRGAIPPG